MKSQPNTTTVVSQALSSGPPIAITMTMNGNLQVCPCLCCTMLRVAHLGLAMGNNRQGVVQRAKHAVEEKVGKIGLAIGLVHKHQDQDAK